MKLLAALPLALALAAVANADVQRRAPAGIAPFKASPWLEFPVRLPLNTWLHVRSGVAYSMPNVPAGVQAVEADVLDCNVLSRYWTTRRGDLTYLATGPAADMNINTYMYPRTADPQPYDETHWSLAECFLNPQKYWNMAKMAGHRTTVTLPATQTHVMVSNQPLEDKDVHQVVRFRTAPDTCMSPSGRFFVLKDASVTTATASDACKAKDGSLADVDTKTIAEVNGVVTSCLGPNKKAQIASWGGYDFGLGGMVFTSAASADGTGAVTIPDSQAYPPVCKATRDRVTQYSLADGMKYLKVDGGVAFNEAKTLCEHHGLAPLHLSSPGTENPLSDISTPWAQAHTVMTLTGLRSSAWIGSSDGANPYPDCLAFFNGGGVQLGERGAVSVPAGSCGALLDGVLCGPAPNQVQRRSEL